MGSEPLKERVIVNDGCVFEGAEWLAARDPDLARAYQLVAPLPLRLKSDGFETLLQAIVSQQVSVASASAIWARMQTAGLTSERAIDTATDGDLQSVGLSRPKIRYARALAAARLDFAALRKLDSAEVIQQLTAVTGIGQWTAEIYVKFSLGRADAFAAGDLALQEGARMLYGLPTRPTEAELRKMSVAWHPWRSVAARILWAYYAHQKSREGVT
ncbi:DNA-3-methyladenine glycosylase family protein [Shimia ponticola]|uniref:DNA-3-methyladenine glycosylase family protein n=1 Tax=Shimia ponticola TaxID=2582893 RepID=UPI002105FBAF|nr:DNA-3-methyladenine glycosylase 2 family protein [Shimia ponticola]